MSSGYTDYILWGGGQNREKLLVMFKTCEHVTMGSVTWGCEMWLSMTTIKRKEISTPTSLCNVSCVTPFPEILIGVDLTFCRCFFTYSDGLQRHSCEYFLHYCTIHRHTRPHLTSQTAKGSCFIIFVTPSSVQYIVNRPLPHTLLQDCNVTRE